MASRLSLLCAAILYAYQLAHPSLWVQMMEKGYNATGWLGLILGTKLWYPFHPAAVETDGAFKKQVDAVCRDLGERGKPKAKSASRVSESVPLSVVSQSIVPDPAPRSPTPRAPVAAPPTALAPVAADAAPTPTPESPALSRSAPVLSGTPSQGPQTMRSMAISPIQSTADSSAVVELSRATVEDMKEMTQTILDREERLRREASEHEERMRREAREDAKDYVVATADKLQEAKAEMAELRREIETLREQLKPGLAPNFWVDWIKPQWSLGGWVARIATLVLVLRWRSLFKLIGRLGDI